MSGIRMAVVLLIAAIPSLHAQAPPAGTYRLALHSPVSDTTVADGWLVVDSVPLRWELLSDTARSLAADAAGGDLTHLRACYSFDYQVDEFRIVAGSFSPSLDTPQRRDTRGGRSLQLTPLGDSLTGILHFSWSSRPELTVALLQRLPPIPFRGTELPGTDTVRLLPQIAQGDTTRKVRDLVSLAESGQLAFHADSWLRVRGKRVGPPDVRHCDLNDGGA
jgi:hypothetical protein